MMLKASTVLLLLLSATLATTASGQSGDILSDNYGIMVPEKGSKHPQPEPWLAPKYKSPKGKIQPVQIPKSKTVSPPKSIIPSSVYVPQTGKTFQNLNTLPGSGPGGTETSQDRAMRCAHQAGVYGQNGVNRGAYMGSCL
jgi:hypothetical protein